MDTSESQALLQYQQRTFDDYLLDLRQALGPLRCAGRVFRPLLRRWLVSRSPFEQDHKPARPVKPSQSRRSEKGAGLRG